MPATSVRVDAKGRLIIPREARVKLRIQPGDTFFVDTRGGVLRYAKATNPLDDLADRAVRDYRRGRTRSLREIIGDRNPG